MRRYISIVFILILLLSGLFLFNTFKSSDSNKSKYGTIHFIDEENKQVTINISAWAAETGLTGKETEKLFEETVKIEENILIKYENGDNASFNDIFTGQKVRIVEDKKNDVTKELILIK